jgi:hypothetical protein
MNKITKFFYGKYLKYWYITFIIIVMLMLVSYYGNRSLKSYRLVLFNADGTISEIEEVDVEKMSNLDNNIIILTKMLPITKAFIPQKQINIKF